MQIIPAILVVSEKKFQDHAQRVFQLCDFIQIDICDGKYVDSKTWPLTENITETDDLYLPNWEECEYSADIMCENPSEILELCVRYGFYEVIFHYKSLMEEWRRNFSSQNFASYLQTLFDKVFYYEMRLALAYHIDDNLEEFLESVESYKDNLSYIQVMGIRNIGKQGEVFQDEVLGTIKKLKTKNFLVCVDGGVNLESIQKIDQAGADAVVVGSALKLDLESYIQNFETLETLVAR